jgi:alkylhydroperoxidase family enzyme
MFKFLVERALDASARRHGGDVSYLRGLYAASPRAFWRIAMSSALGAHREAASVEACHAARLVGALSEDCGPCVQVEVDMARKAGVGDAQIEAVLRADPAAMSADTALGFRFAAAVVSKSAGADEARQALRARWGDKGIIDLTLALQGSRMFPMLKAGLGFATNCQRVSVGSALVEIAHHAA